MMNNKLFQRLFGRKSFETRPSAKRLSLESLESREMLNVDWSGFGAEKTSTYEASSSAVYSVDLLESANACEFADLTGDGRNELIAVNFANRTATVYSNASDASSFVAKSSQALDALSGVSGCDAIFAVDSSLVVVSTTSDFSGLKATTYVWNSTSSSLTKSSETTLDISKFNSSNADVFVVTGVKAAMLGSSLVVQATTLTTTGQTTKTVAYSGYGASSFGTTSSTLTSVTETLMGSTSIDGKNYLILKEATSSANNLVLASVGSTISKYSYSFNAYGSALTFDWVVAQDGFMVVGAQTNGKSGLITIKSTAPVDGTDASTLGQWTSCDDVKFNSSSCAALADVGGDSDPELFTLNGSSYLFYLGDASSEYDYTFAKDSLVVTSPEYVSVYASNGAAILVGATRIYTATMNDDGSLSEPTSAFPFNQRVKKGVFGDFNGDGLTDVAVLYEANVGASLGVFQQLSDGTFMRVATQTFASALVDIGVGKFSQTSVDEIVAMSVSSGSTTATTVRTLKLSSSSLLGTSSYVGSSIVGSALAVGSIYGSGCDDVAIVDATQNAVTTLKNNGSSFSASTMTTVYDGSTVAFPTSAAIGDFNGDGLVDLAVLNSSSGTNYANVVYYLRTETGLGAKPTGRVALNGTSTASTLSAADLNSDGYSDLVLVRKTTSANVCASVLMGNGGTSVFDSVVDRAITVDPTTTYGATLARVDSSNASPDFIWAQDKTVGVLINGDETTASGQLAFLVQSLSSSAGTTYSAASASQREWIDEWSNFYVDVWANATGATVSSVSSSFNYNPDYFKFDGATAATGFSVSASASSGAVAMTATGSGSADSAGWTLVARLKFSPVGGEGVALPEDGALKAVNAGFGASTNSQTLNGAAVESVVAPTSIRLYPYVFDLDENGVLNMNDLSFAVAFLGQRTTNVEPARLRVIDYDLNGVFNMNDLGYLSASLGIRATSGLDSAYVSEPKTSVSNALLDEFFCDAVLDADAAFEEDSFDAFAEEFGADPFDLELDVDF